MSVPIKRWSQSRTPSVTGHSSCHVFRRHACVPRLFSRRPVVVNSVQSYVLIEEESELNAHVAVLEVPEGATDCPPALHGSRSLIMCDPPALQGIYKPLGTTDFLTYQYWDVFMAFPPILPVGPLAIYGFGVGTIARLLLEAYSEPPNIYAWETDAKVLWAAELTMGLPEMQATGRVHVASADALGRDAHFTGENAFAGIMVDMLDKKGQVPFKLTQPAAWKTIRERLRPEGRVMASLGPARQQDGSLNQRAVSALNAMHEAFEGQVLVWEPSTQAAPEGGLGIAGLPALALTGPAPDVEAWVEAVDPLGEYAQGWEPWTPVQLAQFSDSQGKDSSSGSSSDESSSSSGSTSSSFGSKFKASKSKGRLFGGSKSGASAGSAGAAGSGSSSSEAGSGRGDAHVPGELKESTPFDDW